MTYNMVYSNILMYVYMILRNFNNSNRYDIHLSHKTHGICKASRKTEPTKYIIHPREKDPLLFMRVKTHFNMLRCCCYCFCYYSIVH